MSNFGTIYNELTEIRNRANTKTGKNDTTVSDAVDTLIKGFGGGVEGGIIPTGTKNITTNGTHDVYTYEKVNVAVPTGITPSGTLSITENNKTFDVTNYASATVAIPENSTSFVLDVTSTLGGTSATTHTIKTGDAFAKAHYTHTDFKALLMALFTVPNDVVGNTGIIVQGNVDISSATSTNATIYGVRGWHSAAATFAFGGITVAATGNSTHTSFRFTSSGDIKVYLPAKMYLPAGRYLVALACGCS